ncbi:inner membrane protein [mine drainage metagenome]|uniref:Inner membrane protein n=1 Tax=mine drainage metagenome TaxID=410659 RepID=T0YD11_9ZZZZ
MFWVHRLQHLILHHVGPALLVLSAPVSVLRAGLPGPVWRVLSASWVRRPIGLLWRVLQHELLAPVLFVGLIYFWLTPSVQFLAMLSQRLYLLMNWSIFIDGILFWWMILAPIEAQGAAAVPYGRRVIVLTAVALPQIVLGAYITLCSRPLYSIYAVCGRAWHISPDCSISSSGGCSPGSRGAMMSAVGVLVILHHVLQADRRALAETRAKAADASAGAPA